MYWRYALRPRRCDEKIEGKRVHRLISRMLMRGRLNFFLVCLPPAGVRDESEMSGRVFQSFQSTPLNVHLPLLGPYSFVLPILSLSCEFSALYNIFAYQPNNIDHRLILLSSSCVSYRHPFFPQQLEIAIESSGLQLIRALMPKQTDLLLLSSHSARCHHPLPFTKSAKKYCLYACFSERYGTTTYL